MKKKRITGKSHIGKQNSIDKLLLFLVLKLRKVAEKTEISKNVKNMHYILQQNKFIKYKKL